MVDITEEDRIVYGLPLDYSVGQAVADGNCFFDSFRQGLIALGVTEPVDVPRLREICAEVGQLPPPWLLQLLNYSQLGPNRVRSETPEQYVKRVLRDGSWGEPELDGRILCQHFNVSLYLIEVHDQDIVTRHIITGDDGVCSVTEDPFRQPNILYIINRGCDHFEPILKANNIINSVTSSANNLRKDRSKEGNESNRLIIEKHSPVNLTLKQNPELKPTSISSTNLPSVSPTATKIYCHGQIYNLKLPAEFENVHRAILTHDLGQVEESLAEYRNMLHHQSPPEQELMQHSLYDAMLSYNIRIVEVVYEHWATALYTSHSHYFQTLRRLGKALIVARDSCFKELNQMLIDVYCIIELNKFRIQLHRELIDYRNPPPNVLHLNETQQRVHQIIGILITAINVYAEFSNKFTSVIDNELVNAFSLELILLKITDDSSLNNTKFLLYAMFEKYYRKLDFTIATTILKYIHSLKLRLKLPKDTYQNIECTLYYFLYRMNEEWRLYMPDDWVEQRNRMTNCSNLSEYFDVFYDPDRLVNGPLIYMEWQKYKESLLKFKRILETTSVKDHIREKGSKLPKNEVHSLTLLPYLRDEYSLKKIIAYLEACARTIKRCPTHKGTLVIQRVLQVTGELLKSTVDTLHLSITTKALIYAYIPHSVLRNLHTLRNNLSHIRDGKLIRKIHLEETNPELFLDVADDLMQIRNILQKVIDVYKPIVEKSLIENGLSLVHERQKDLPLSLEDHISIVQKMFETVGDDNYIEELTNRENLYTDEEWSKFGTTKSVYKEQSHLIHLILTLKKEWADRDMTCVQNIVKNLNSYFKQIEKITNDIETNLKTWNNIKANLNGLSTEITTNLPTKDSLKSIKITLKKFSKSHADICADLTSKLNSVVLDWTSEWSTIFNSLEFLIKELAIFSNHPKQIKKNEFTLRLKNIFDDQPNGQRIVDLRIFLDFMKQEVKQYCSKYNILPGFAENTHDYTAIERLTKAMSKKFFITRKEAGYLKLKIPKCKCLSKYCVHEALVEKILSGESISVKDRDTVIKNIQMNDKCKTIIQNLVVGNIRDSCSLQCLTTRTKLLKEAIGNQKMSQLVQRYHYDNGFRLSVEALLADIHNVLTERQLWSLIDSSASQLLTEYPLRNILEHGNPLLDVVGEKIDTSLVPATLFKFALSMVDDEPILSTLFELHEQGVRREQAKSTWVNPQSLRLQEYFSLLPDEAANKANAVNNLDEDQKPVANQLKNIEEVKSEVTMSKMSLTTFAPVSASPQTPHESENVTSALNLLSSSDHISVSTTEPSKSKTVLKTSNTSPKTDTETAAASVAFLTTSSNTRKSDTKLKATLTEASSAATLAALSAAKAAESAALAATAAESAALAATAAESAALAATAAESAALAATAAASAVSGAASAAKSVTTLVATLVPSTND